MTGFKRITTTTTTTTIELAPHGEPISLLSLPYTTSLLSSVSLSLVLLVRLLLAFLLQVLSLPFFSQHSWGRHCAVCCAMSVCKCVQLITVATAVGGREMEMGNGKCQHTKLDKHHEAGQLQTESWGCCSLSFSWTELSWVWGSVSDLGWGWSSLWVVATTD